MHRTSAALILLSSAISLQANAQSPDKEFAKQTNDKEGILRICQSQYENANYLSITTKDESFDNSLARLAGETEDFEDFRFVSTSKGTQAISPLLIEELPTGKWKCARGSIEAPMRLGREYRVSAPIYGKWPQSCRQSLFSAVGIPCNSSRIVGHATRRLLLKEEQCKQGGTCLVLYKISITGKASRQVIAVSMNSLQNIFPYDERKYQPLLGLGESSEKIFLGPPALECYTYPGLGDAAYLKRRYISCLGEKAKEWN